VLVRLLATNETRAAWEPPGPHDLIADPSLSLDGRFVAVYSSADLTGDGAPAGVFVIDTETGTAERAAVDADGVPLQMNTYSPSISADASTVAYQALSCGPFGGCDSGVWVTDLVVQSGSPVRNDGAWNDEPSLSGNGRYVAWLVHFLDTGTDTHGVYVQDRLSGASISIDGRADPAYQEPAISADGSTVAFAYSFDDLAAGDANGVIDTLVWAPCPLASRNDGPATGAVHSYVAPHAGDLSFTVDQVGCDLVRPHGL
jgi:Tol biopolymer transport system component